MKTRPSKGSGSICGIRYWHGNHRKKSSNTFSNWLSGAGALPGGSDGKEFACNAGDPGSILGQEDPLEKGMAHHSSILAWRIPWTEKPGRLQSMSDFYCYH